MRLFHVKCDGRWRELIREIRRAARVHELSLENRIKKNPKAFYTSIINKRVTMKTVGG